MQPLSHQQAQLPLSGRHERRQQQERHRLHRAYGRAVGIRALAISASRLVREEGISRSSVRYWSEKIVRGLAFHGGTSGAVRAGYEREVMLSMPPHIITITPQQS